MIRHHLSERGSLQGKEAADERARHGATELLLESDGPRDVSSRYPANPAVVSSTTKASRVDWETIAIWTFVVFSFAVQSCAGYVLWAKCHGNSPF